MTHVNPASTRPPCRRSVRAEAAPRRAEQAAPRRRAVAAFVAWAFASLLTGAGATGPAAALVAASCLMAPPRAASAQQAAEPRVTAQVDRLAVYLGDAVTLRIIIENARDTPPPALPEIDGVTARFISTVDNSSSFVSIVNGRRTERRTEQFVHQYTLTPSRPGEFTIPALRVEARGTPLVTEPITVRVEEPAAAPADILDLSVEDDTLFVNQTTGLELVWLIADANAVRQFDARASALPEGVEAVITQHPQARRYPGRYPRVELFGTEGNAEVQQVERDGKTYTALVIKASITPTRAGDVDLGPMTIVFDSDTGRGGVRRFAVRSKPVPVRVVDPPAEGRPANFTGLVGTFAVRAEASAAEVSVGDPIELRVTIAGAEPLRGVTDGPNLAAQPDIAQSFRLSPEGWRFDPSGRVGERVFVTTVRATTDALAQIPAIELPFLDPKTGRYRVAKSDPIPLTVRPVNAVTLEDAVAAGGGPPPAAYFGAGPGGASGPVPLTPTRAGLWTIARGPAVLAGERADSAAFPGPLAFFWALAPPLLAGAGLAAWHLARRSSARRSATALRRSLAALRANGSAPAVRELFAGVRGVPIAAITAADCRETLRNAATPALRAALERALAVLESAEAAAYSTTPGDTHAVRAHTPTVSAADLRTIAQALRRADAQTDAHPLPGTLA